MRVEQARVVRMRARSTRIFESHALRKVNRNVYKGEWRIEKRTEPRTVTCEMLDPISNRHVWKRESCSNDGERRKETGWKWKSDARRAKEKEDKEGETDSPILRACPVCPCTVGGMLHVDLTARIYILPARIFISVRGRVTSSMTGGRDACCLAWLCLTAFLRTSLRRATGAWHEGHGVRSYDA